MAMYGTKPAQKVNYYYYTGEVLDEAETDLLHLCPECRSRFYRGESQWAGTGDDDTVCQECGTSNNPDSPFATAAFLD